MMTEKKEKVYGKSDLWREASSTPPFCAGCQEPLGAQLILEVIEDLGIEDKTIFLGGGGCVYSLPPMVKLDAMQCPKGRSVSIGSAIKQYLGDDAVVVIYQDDNDTLATGTESMIQTASRGDPVTVIMANIGSYGSTGWQMVSKANAVNVPEIGKPNPDFNIDIVDLMREFEGVAYLARGSAHNPESVDTARTYVKAAIQKQIDNAGFSLVDILMACPDGWGMTPAQSLKWVEEEMVSRFPPGEYKSVDQSQKGE